MQLGPNYLVFCLHCLEATKLKQEAVEVFLRILSSGATWSNLLSSKLLSHTFAPFAT